MSYDAWLEAPYQRRAAVEERLERLEEDIYSWPFEEFETCLDGARNRDLAWAVFDAIDKRQPVWNRIGGSTPFGEVLERSNDEEHEILSGLLQQAAEDYDEYLNREGQY